MKNLKVEERGYFVFKYKLRLLKEKLRWWNKEEFGKIDLEVEKGVRDLNLADERLRFDPNYMHIENLDKRKEATSRFLRNLRIE